MKKLAGILFALGIAWVSASGQVSTNIADIYSCFGFDPNGENCATIVQVSDIHMSQIPPLLVWAMDDRLVNMVNSISPQPTVLMVTGDLGMGGSPSPGFAPIWPAATNEIARARSELERITNCGSMYVVPGNHDTMYGREDGYLFTNVYVGFCHFTNFTVAGLPVIMLDSQNGGWIDSEQHEWLVGMRRGLDENKEVLLAMHFPPLVATPGAIGRELGDEVLWFARGWQADVWVANGHNHCRAYNYFPFGTTTIKQYMVPSANQLIDSASNYCWCMSSGFAVWCVSNGTVKGIVSAAVTNASYFVLAPAVASDTCRPYQNQTDVLFHVEEGHFQRSDYSVTVTNKNSRDVTYFWNYVDNYVCRLPFDRYPQATRVFSLQQLTNNCTFYLGPDTNTWYEVPCEYCSNSVASLAIPPALRASPLWLRVHGVPGAMIGGFGLGTTNPLSSFASWAGKAVGDANLSPDTLLPWGGTAWQAFLFGADPLRRDPLRESGGFPWMGGWPSRQGDTVRFGARTSLVYTVEQAATIGGPWSSAAVIWGLATNGWREGTITKAGSLVYRISAR